jgi:hypothetical protein
MGRDHPGLPGGMSDGRILYFLSDVVLAAGPIGVRILSRADLEHAERLKIAADLNAVLPFGIEGVDAKADGAPLGFAPGIGIGALAIGRVKFELQHALLRRIRSAETAQSSRTGKPISARSSSSGERRARFPLGPVQLAEGERPMSAQTISMERHRSARRSAVCP